VNTRNLKVKANMSESYITKIGLGNKVTITLPEIDQRLDAKVTFIGKNINALSRTFPIEIGIPTNKVLRPNMTAVVKVIFHTEKDALVVPVNIIQEINGRKIVYVAEQNGVDMVAKRREVTIDGVFNNQAQVQGLKAGDKIITVGYQDLSEGELLKV